nr:DUF484 family protein [Pseudomonas sp.]
MHDAITFSATDIAEFLKDNPAFFGEHADIFATLTVPHPHEGRAISLSERQVLTMRERVRTLETKLATLTRNANDSQRIIEGIQQWSVTLMAESDPVKLPDQVTQGLAEVFSVPYAALRLWGCGGGELPPCPGDEGAAWRQPVSDETERFAASLSTPYCGTDTSSEAATWLGVTPASIALIALRTPRGNTIGMLALGSDDADRFAADMGTDFLAQMGALAGAALSRLMSR